MIGIMTIVYLFCMPYNSLLPPSIAKPRPTNNNNNNNNLPEFFFCYFHQKVKLAYGSANRERDGSRSGWKY